MEYIVGAIILMWIFSALGGDNSFEAKAGWGIIISIVLFYLLFKLAV